MYLCIPIYVLTFSRSIWSFPFFSCTGHRHMLCAPANLPCYYVFDAQVAGRLVTEAEKEPEIIMGHLCASNDRPIERPAAFLFNRATNRMLVDSIPMNTSDLWDALDKCTKRLWVKSERRYSLYAAHAHLSTCH